MNSVLFILYNEQNFKYIYINIDLFQYKYFNDRLVKNTR